MKFKRLLIAMVLVISVAATAAIFTGCGDPVTEKTEAIAMLQAADDQMEGLTGYSMTVSGTARESGYDVSMSGTIKVAEDKFSMEMKTAMTGMTMDLSFYYTDGYLYTKGPGTNNKTKVDFEEAFEDAFGNMDTSVDEEIYDEFLGDEEWIFKGSVKGGKDVFTFTKGDNKYTFNLNKNGKYTYIRMVVDDMDMTMKINHSSPKITFPSDLDTYNEWGF